MFDTKYFIGNLKLINVFGFKKNHYNLDHQVNGRSKKQAWEHVMIAEALKERCKERAKSILSKHLELLIK